MGTYWRVLNIDKREVLECWGKIEEWIPTFVDAIIPHLTIPPTPIETKRTWEYGGEHHTYWVDLPYQGSWAGDRVICLGDYGRFYPSGILTEKELKELKEMEMSLYELANEEYKEVHDSHIEKHREVCLRNLSTREFVCLESVSKYIATNYEGRIGMYDILGLAVFCRIAYGAGDDEVDGIEWGKWAGDRFDIRPRNNIDVELAREEGWIDVSVEIALEVIAMQKLSYMAELISSEIEPMYGRYLW